MHGAMNCRLSAYTDRLAGVADARCRRHRLGSGGLAPPQGFAIRGLVPHWERTAYFFSSPASFRTHTADELDAFLPAFDQRAAYDSPNFLWLRSRYPRCVYAARIV